MEKPNKLNKLDEVALFIDFLQKNGITGKFKKNYEETKTLLFFNPMCFFARSFSWEKTEDGYDFWNEIDKEWRIVLEKFRQEKKKKRNEEKIKKFIEQIIALCRECDINSDEFANIIEAAIRAAIIFRQKK
jgi:MinD-like ATPase involved in chromosome partitioning or flagellar assembly